MSAVYVMGADNSSQGAVTESMVNEGRARVHSKCRAQDTGRSPRSRPDTRDRFDFSFG